MIEKNMCRQVAFGHDIVWFSTVGTFKQGVMNTINLLEIVFAILFCIPSSKLVI